MKRLFAQTMILTAVLTNWGVAVGQQPDFDGELQVIITNPSTAVPISVDAVGVVWGKRSDGFPITHAYDHYDAVTNGFYAQHVDNGEGDYVVGYGRYKITITKGSQNFVAYADYRDCDYQDPNYPPFGRYITNPDIVFEFDYTEGEFVTNDDAQIWDPDHKSQSYQNSSCFLIPVTVKNNFTGGQIKVDGITYTSPRTANFSLSSTHTIAAISPQTIGSANYVWCAWSNGGAQTHEIQIQGFFDSETYTANFLGSYISGPDFLYKGQNGTYNSNPSGGSGNRSYQWYRKYDGSSTWDPLGASQTQQVTMHSTGFTLKVNVIDNVYSKTVTSTKYVSYGAFAGEDSTAVEDNGGSSAGLQNHPNPFNPQTTISYRSLQENHVTLKVYDILGREVITLVDERQTPGQHSTFFDAGNLASGIYWYRLQIGSFSETKKFTLIR